MEKIEEMQIQHQQAAELEERRVAILGKTRVIIMNSIHTGWCKRIIIH